MNAHVCYVLLLMEEALVEFGQGREDAARQRVLLTSAQPTVLGRAAHRRCYLHGYGLTVHELADLLECSWIRINHWRKAGLLVSLRFGEKRDFLYQRPSATVLAEIRRRQRRQCWKPDKLSANV